MATKEEDNFLRMVYLNYRVGTTALRRYFDVLHPNLPSKLSCPLNKAILLSLHRPSRGQKRVLYPEQWNILYPTSGSPVVSSADLDVTLMVCLLRNLPPSVSPPTAGFDVLPQTNDLSHGAHIARIKYYKNFIVSHSKDGKLSDTDFQRIWIDLEMAIHGLGTHQDVTEAIDAKSKVLDYNALKELVNFGDSIQRNAKRLNEYFDELVVQSSKIRKLETTVENIEIGTNKECKDKLVHCTILDKEVLDNLISKCVLTLDDRKEVVSIADQSARNKKLLKILKHRPYNTFNIFVEAVKESDQECHTSIVVNMEAKFSKRGLTSKNVPYNVDITDLDKQAVKLIKWFKPLVQKIDIERTGILDNLSAKGVISYNDNAELKSTYITPQEKSRVLLENIIRKNVSSAYATFLDVLREDSCYQEYATKIEETDVTQFDLELLYIGRITREKKKKKKQRKARKRNGMTDLMIDKIEKWERDDSLYINTRATVHVLTCINKHKCVSVTGPSGIGKTALVRHVALQMETNGYTILPMTDGKEIKDNYKSDRKTLYIVDDMCGNFTANQRRLEEWKKSKDDIKSILDNSRYKLIVTCRLQVFQDKGFDNLEIFKTCECNLKSDGLSLTYEEKENITKEYFQEHAVSALKHLGEYEFLPLLCKLYYVEKNNQQFTLDMFLNDPFSFYKKDLTNMYNDCKEGKYKYCALLLLVIFNNQLGEKHLTGKDPRFKTCIEDIVEVCDIDESITGRKLKNQLEILTGTFVTNDEGIYKTIHDKLFDFLAFYFGTQEEIIDILIKHAKDGFIRERCLVSGGNESIHYSIPISDNKLQMYITRVCDDIVSSSKVKTDIAGNINIKNVKFRTMLLDFMEHLSKHEIAALVKKANPHFLNTMFILRKKDIKDNVGNWLQEFKSFGIVLTDDMLQQYIEKWFNGLIETNSTEEFMRDNRLFACVTFCTALKLFMTQLSPESVSLCIQTGSRNVINTIFVFTEHDIKSCAKKQNERFGIVISDDLLQQYIERMFDDLTKSDLLEDDIDLNRPLMNVSFHSSFRTYIRQLTTEKIASLIQTADDTFINKMFVMTEEDIKENVQNRYECFGIVIPKDLLQQYIHRLFDILTTTRKAAYYINDNRPLMNDSFLNAFRTYIRQLTTEKIASLIQIAEDDFFNKMFVMSESEIKENTEHRYECFGIVIPDDLLQQYIQRLLDVLTKTNSVGNIINENRPLMNATFCIAFRFFMSQLTSERTASLIQTVENDFLNAMFVMTEEDINENSENRYECFGIVIPNDLLQQYIQRLFDDLTKNLIRDMQENRPLMNVSFRTAFRTYIRQLNTEKIASLIPTADQKFLNNMFVMTEKDIQENAKNRNECYGIVIPDALLQQYCQKLFDMLTKSYSVVININRNRPLMNVTFRTAFCTYINEIKKVQISSLIQTANEDFFNKMFVMTEEDIKEIAENQIEYECFGIVIPDDMLQQYCKRLFDYLTNIYWQMSPIDKKIRPLQNVNFRSTFRTYINELTTEQIASLIQIAGDEFFHEMFVMTLEDINQNGEEQTAYFAIVIPDDLLQQYIKRLFDGLTASQLWRLTYNRPMKSERFRTAFSTYMRQLTTEQIASLIYTAEEDFFNNLFFIAEEDMEENVENRYNYFGIEIPDNLLQQYIQRLFDDLTKAYSVERNINENRLFMNITFRATFCTYINQLTKVQIASIIQTARDDFVNTMFVMAEEDIKENGEKRYECFGIVIPDDLLQQYIQRWFDNLTKTYSVEGQLNETRPLMNSKFQSAFRTYIRQLPTVKIDSLILIANKDFINQLFVMTEEDIEEHADNRYEWFGIVIPDDLLQQYIQRWFDDLITISDLDEFMEKNRPLKNETFCNALCNYTKKLSAKNIAYLILNAKADFLNIMFIMSKEDVKVNSKNRYECFSIVIPGDLLQQYIERWFECLTKAELEKFLDRNRPLNNVSFRIALRTYMEKTKAETVAHLIQTGSIHFLNTMFVMTADDIKDNGEPKYASFGIVIPDDLLQQYIKRWFNYLTNSLSIHEFMDNCRPLHNVLFRTALRTYMRQLKTKDIVPFIQTGRSDFLNTCFVMTDEEIEDNDGNRHGCFGIVIPDDMLQQYIGRWFNDLSKKHRIKSFMDENRLLTNVTFCTALRTFMKQLNRAQIAYFIQAGSTDFLNTMFVMTEDDIKDDCGNRHGWFGIVVPDDILLLQQYIERWFQSVTNANLVKEYMNDSRLLTNASFRNALRTYMRLFDTDEIETLIRTGSSDFLNTMFVLTEEDIVNDNAEYRFESFGIVIPDDMLQQYIDRWLECMKKTDSVREFVGDNRSSMRVILQTELEPYMNQITVIYNR